MKTINIKFIGILIIVCLTGCEDLLKIDSPKTQLASEVVFSNKNTAEAVMVGIYARMFDAGGITSSMTRSNGLAADELVGYSVQSNMEFYNNEITPVNPNISGFWTEAYQYIYTANSILEGISNSRSLDIATRNALKGEAIFIRAFCYYYLTNLWGDVPFTTTTDYRINAMASRNPTDEIYNSIIQDLKESIELLPSDYEFSQGERLRPNRHVAMALLARLYLQLQNWADAEFYASQIIEKSTVYSLEEDLNNVFVKESKEAIWQLRNGLNFGVNSFDAEIFITSERPSVAVSNELLDAFESNDLRKVQWTKEVVSGANTYSYPFKYKIRAGGTTPPISEYLMVIRLAELYLIRAEARAQQNKYLESITDVDMIRHRAGLPRIADTTPDISKDELLSAILHERRVELFTEWSHRWLDLKRLNITNQVLSPIKVNWQGTDVLYPLPQTEMEKAPRLRPQNLGY